MQAFLSQVLLGLINGAFYAMLSLGLAVIFGLLNIINFAHGAQYMMGALAAWLLATYFGVNYWAALIVVPVIVGGLGMLLEKTVIRRTYRLEHLFGLLLTLGIASIIEGLFVNYYGAVGRPYPVPSMLQGAVNLGFMVLPLYRAWVIVASLAVCLITWAVIERTKLGSYLRAATENPPLVLAFGINVPRMIMLTYGLGVGLAALAGVMAAPIYQVNPLMGSNLIIVVFAVVVIGGMGSIMGSVVTGFGVGLIEGITKALWPEASGVVVFVLMAIVLLIKPAGLFGKPFSGATLALDPEARPPLAGEPRQYLVPILAMAALLIVAPAFIYPVFLMKVLCFALFAVSFNLLIGFVGLGSFGHAMFLGLAGYVTGHVARNWGWPPEFAILGGTAAAAALGLVTGVLAVRRQKIYFAMVTLAFAEMVYFFCVQAPFTGGEDGMQQIPQGKLFELIDLAQTMPLYYVVLCIFLLGFLIAFRTINSPFGQVLKAIRENEPRAISLGYNPDRYKLLIFVISAALAGLAGSMKAIVFQIASLQDVYHSTSGDVILMALVGGLGTIFGPLVGAFAIVGMQQYLAPLGQWVVVVQGVIFVVCVLTFRQGIIGLLARWIGRPL